MNTFEGKNAKTTVGNYQGFATTTRLWRFHRYGGMTATVAAVFGRASALLTIGIGTFCGIRRNARFRAIQEGSSSPRTVKLLSRLGSSIEASRRGVLDKRRFGNVSRLAGRGRVGRFLCPDGFSRSDNARCIRSTPVAASVHRTE